MRPTRFIPLAVLAFAAACSDTATSPTSVGRPLFDVTPGTFGPATLNAAGTPSGGHLQSGSIFCAVSGALAITCSSTGGYQINGVGNSNATAALTTSYTATVNCTNHGGKLVPVKTQVTGAGVSSGSLSPENGHLTVPPITASTPTAALLAAATCPNGNWTKALQAGSPVLVSFTYTLTFDGFSTPAVNISQS